MRYMNGSATIGHDKFYVEDGGISAAVSLEVKQSSASFVQSNLEVMQSLT